MSDPADSLPDDPATLKAMLLAERTRAERLAQIIKETQRHRFGRPAETLPEDQLLKRSSRWRQQWCRPSRGPSRQPRKRRASLSAGPIVALYRAPVTDRDGHRRQDYSCSCCREALHVIGEDRAERLDTVSAQFRVLVIRRPKYACRVCEDVVVQTSAPPRLIEGGIRTEATVAQVLISKYADDLVLLSQKVAALVETNHVFGKIHFSAREGLR
jgi:transposase